LFVCGVWQEYDELPNSVQNLANNHGTILPVQYNNQISKRRAIYSINLSTETDQYYFVSLNDTKGTLRCSRPQHRCIPHCNHRTAIRHQLKERGYDISKIKRTRLAMRHRQIWDPDEGIADDEKEEKLEFDMERRWVPPPKYMTTDNDNIGYESMESDEPVQEFLDNLVSNDPRVRDRHYRINERKAVRDKYYDYLYEAPNADAPLKPY